MKTILYLLLVVFCFSIVSTGFSSKEKPQVKTILLQSNDVKVQENDLLRSVGILKARLKAFGVEKLELLYIKDKNQIKVSYNSDLNSDLIVKLITQKGNLLFLNLKNEEVASKFDVEQFKTFKSQQSPDFEIEIKFKKSSIEKWAQVTKTNINKNIAIVLDGKTICSPVLRSEIKNGTCIITGNFTETEANFIASLGNSEILPVSFVIVQ